MFTLSFIEGSEEPQKDSDDAEDDANQQSREWYFRIPNARLEKLEPPNHYFLMPRQQNHRQCWRREQLNPIERLPQNDDGWEEEVESDIGAPRIVPPESNEAVVEDGHIEWESFCDEITFDNRYMNPVGARMIGHNNNTEYLTPFFL